MRKSAASVQSPVEAASQPVVCRSLWDLDLAEVTGHNLESRGRQIVNGLLATGWLLLHIYTLRYEENGVWRERPMAILGRPRHNPGISGGEGGTFGAAGKQTGKNEFTSRLVSLTKSRDAHHCGEKRRP